MKKIVLILFMVSLVFGQANMRNTIVPYSGWMDSLKVNDLDRGFYKSDNSLVISVLLAEYDLYKAECYKDSTYVGDLIVRYYLPEYKIWADSIKTNYYQHEIPDLDGFMEYLRRKTK